MHTHHQPRIAFCLALITVVAAASFLSGCNKKTGQLRSDELSTVQASSVSGDFDVTGTYRFEAIRTSAASAPFIGEIKNQLLLEGIATLTQQDDGSVVMTRDVCNAELLSAKEAVKSTISQEFLRQLYSDSRTGITRIEDGVAHLEFPDVYYISGAQFEDAANEELPTTPDDPRVIDADNDGNPGITIHVEGLATGQIYMVQRITSAWHSTAISDTGIQGQIEWSEERGMLGATSRRLESKRDSWVTDDPSENRFVMLSVADDTTCDGVGDQGNDDVDMLEEKAPVPEGAIAPTEGAPTDE